MTWLLRIVAFLHMAVYIGIVFWGWQSYRILRKNSWLYMGVGFGILLIFRTDQFYALWTHPVTEMSVRQMWETFTPFVGAIFLVISFWLVNQDYRQLIDKLRKRPAELSAGDQPVEFWEDVFRKIVSEEVAKIKLKSV